MLSEQIAPTVAIQTGYNPFLANINSKDETCLIAFENSSLQHTSIPMTKQLTTSTTTTATTISSNCSLAPTAISPTTSTGSAVTSPAKGALRKGSVSAAANSTNATNINTPTVTVTATATATSTTAAANITLGAAQKTKPPAASSSNDASGRSAALERAYVHDVYEHCEEPTGPIRPRVAQFLSNLDPGSVVCDVGCGSGRYLTQCNPAICTVGVDRCYRLSKVAREKGGEVALCDNLELPFRDESFDAVLSLAVVHHFATTERRVNALRELARILRIGGRVIITVWALEQRHRRFESQDVLIPWQPPKNRNFNYSDEEEDDDFLPPYHAYTEDSTNSSRSAGDGDSSSLSSSSPGESCYSFVRRAIQKLASGRRHPWFLDSWTSKETKNDSSLDYEDAKDLPIELRRLEDFEDFPDPPLSAGLKSRSLGSILNPPPRQIVRSRSSVPSLGGPPVLHTEANYKTAQNAQFLAALDGAPTAAGGATANGHSPTNLTGVVSNNAGGTPSLGRRPKLIKQKQSLCDEDYQLPENPFHMISSYNSSSHSYTSGLLYLRSGCYHANGHHTPQHHPMTNTPLSVQASILLRKQSSLNEELMAGNRIREKERVRKRIQKQMSLNEAFLCRSAMLSKRLQVIREGFTSKIKSSTGSLERVTKHGFSKLIQNFKAPPAADAGCAGGTSAATTSGAKAQTHCQCLQQHQPQHHHHHHSNQQQQQQQSAHTGSYRSHLPHLLQKQNSTLSTKLAGPVIYCNNAECASAQSACYCSAYHHSCNCGVSNPTAEESAEVKARRHSRESGSDSSKDSSLQSDTSIESEDSFASVIFIPKPEQHQQQLNYQQQHQNSNSSSSNSSSSNGGSGSGACQLYSGCCHPKGCSGQPALCKANCMHINGCGQQQHHHAHQHRAPSAPTSPLIMPCPPTPAHSPAAAQAAVTSPPQTVAAVAAAMAILTPPCSALGNERTTQASTTPKTQTTNSASHNRFNFDEAHIKLHEGKQEKQQPKETHETKKHQHSEQLPKKAELQSDNKPAAVAPAKITRQTINDLPPIPKFRKQQSLQLQRQSFPIVRRSSASAGAAPSIPKLLSLELFNPATDDLDSDSSEPSSPDSIDSVISAPKSATLTATVADESAKNTEAEEQPQQELQQEEFEQHIKLKQQQYHNGDLKISAAAPHDIIINDDSFRVLPTHLNGNQHHTSTANKPPKDCSQFAEQLSAQLLREIEEKNNRAECRSLDGLGGDISEYLDDPLSGPRRRNGEPRDLTALREELRERRLMLANLSTQPSLQQSPTSSSTSSLSSQTRSFTIHEEDEEAEEDAEENERSYSLQLYENCKVSKFNYKRNRHYQLNPETAYLLQDDGDSSARDEDEMEEIEHDVILEEDEEAVAAAERDGEIETKVCNTGCATVKEKPSSKHFAPGLAAKEQEHKQSNSLQNRQSTDSWEHSNSSTNSLDSPSQGGATTHHRYYHVFREGELDALINHHVTSLHIVSSYYERASWCVVAEKVQVWTI